MGLGSKATAAAGLVLGLALPVAACGTGGSEGDDTPAATGETPADQAGNPANAGDTANPGDSGTGAAPAAAGAPPPCSQERHVVVIDVAGLLTVGDETQMWANWINGVTEPEVRPGGPELSQAYRERGYQVLYSITVPPSVLIDDQPPPVAVQLWLERNGFAADEDRTQVLGYTGDSIAINDLAASITDELLRLDSTGARVDAGYTDNDYRVNAFAAGGIPPERIFTLGPNAATAGTTVIPNDDLFAHLPTVQALPPVCTLD